MNRISIIELEKKVEKARESFRESKGSTWSGLCFCLCALAEAYRRDRFFDKALACEKEADTILREADGKAWSPAPAPACTESFLDRFEGIFPLIERAEGAKRDLGAGGDPLQYAYVKNLQCEFLPNSRMGCEMALVNYREAIMALRQDPDGDDPNSPQMSYLHMILLLQSSRCCRELGDEGRARSYLAEALLLIEQNSGISFLSSTERTFITELTYKLI